MKKVSGKLSRLVAITITVVGALVCLSDSASALSIVFNVSSGSWNDAANWTPAVIPTGTDSAFIRGNRTANILTDVGTITLLNMSNNATGSGTLNIESGGALAVSDSVYVGNYSSATTGGTGFLNITGGTLTVSGSTLIGNSGGSTYNSAGTLSLSSGVFSGQAVTLGVAAGTQGTANIDGGSFTAAGTTIVGNSGNGTVSVNGGTASLQSLTIGANATGQGSVTVSNGSLTAGTTVIGSSGSASMTVSGGTVTVSTFTVSSQNGSTGSLVISGGQFTGTSTGNYFLGSRVASGTTNATFTQTGGSFQLGDSTGNGTLIIGSANGETQTVHGNATISGGTFTAKMIIGGDTGLGDGVLTVIGDDATIGSTATGTVLDLRATGAITFQLDATGISTLDYALGTVAFDNGFTLNIDGTNYAGGAQTFTLIDAGAFANGNLANLNVNIYGFSAMYGSPTLEFSGSDLNLVIAVPEPSTWMLFGLGLGALLWRTCIRRRIS